MWGMKLMDQYSMSCLPKLHKQFGYNFWLRF